MVAGAIETNVPDERVSPTTVRAFRPLRCATVPAFAVPVAGCTLPQGAHLRLQACRHDVEQLGVRAFRVQVPVASPFAHERETRNNQPPRVLAGEPPVRNPIQR